MHLPLQWTAGSLCGLYGVNVAKNAVEENIQDSECAPIPHLEAVGKIVRVKESRKNSASINSAKVRIQIKKFQIHFFRRSKKGMIFVPN